MTMVIVFNNFKEGLIINKAKKLVMISVTALVLMLFSASAAMAGQSFTKVVEQIDGYLQQASTAYQQGNVTEARKLVDEAYFGPYEQGGMETTVRANISAKRNAEVEAAVRQLRKEMGKGTSPDQVKQLIDDLIQGLEQDAKILDGKFNGNASGFGVFLSSFLIIVREGFEAILIIGAIIAYLVKSGHESKVKVIYQSTLVAVLASLVTAWIFTAALKVSGVSGGVIEGATMLIAVAVLFSVSYWLVSKSEAKRWQNYIEGKVQGSLTKGNTLALWSAVFLAVYREGAETVLFYQAMLSGSTSISSVSMIIAGLLAGAVALVLIFLVIRYGSVKIPLKPFFLGTSMVLYYMAFVFAGQGVGALQTAGLVSSTAVSFPTITWLGVYPTWESLLPQAILLGLAAFGFVYQQRQRKSFTKVADGAAVFNDNKT